MEGKPFDPEATRCEKKRSTPRGGDRLDDKYGIERELGRGSLGIVYAAWHIGLNRRVAIRVLRPELAKDARAVASFRARAKDAAAITNDAAVKVFDVGVLPSGTPYIVMELLDGESLASVVAERGPLAPLHAIDLVLSACEAIAEAHRRGIVHRGIEPKNLVVPRDATVTPVKVLDFGIACTSAAEVSRQDRRAIVTRASAFNAPEHFAGASVDARADIWSLGATLHFLVSGRPPFDGNRAYQICAKILSQDPPRLRAHRPDAPEPLERVIAKCMRRARSDRYASVQELVRALRDVKRELASAPKSNPLPTVEMRTTLKLPVIARPKTAPAAQEIFAAGPARTVDIEDERMSAALLAAVCCLVLFLALFAALSLGTHAVATTKRVAVSTHSSPQLFARP